MGPGIRSADKRLRSLIQPPSGYGRKTAFGRSFCYGVSGFAACALKLTESPSQLATIDAAAPIAVAPDFPPHPEKPGPRDGAGLFSAKPAR
jgi:hypothetical protein